MYFLSTSPVIIEDTEEYKIQTGSIYEATYTFHIEKIRSLIKIATLYSEMFDKNADITIAKKILSPLTFQKDLDSIPSELIIGVSQMAAVFHTLEFPEWFNEHDKKKRVCIHVAFVKTLETAEWWSSVPFTKLNSLEKNREKISEYLNDIFRAVYPKYKIRTVLHTCKNSV
jgi:hypothetical protein